MKKIVRFCALLIPTVLVISCGSRVSDQSKFESKKGETNVDSILSHIQKKIHAINSSTSFESIQVDLLELSTEGGEMLALIDGGDLRKATVTFYGEMGKRTDEFYFEKGRLIHLFRQNFEYDKPIYIEGSSVVIKNEERFYFHSDQLIRWINSNSKIVDPRTEEAIGEVESICEYVAIVFEALSGS